MANFCVEKNVAVVVVVDGLTDGWTDGLTDGRILLRRSKDFDCYEKGRKKMGFGRSKDLGLYRNICQK